MRRFLQLVKTIRVAQTLEDRRQSRTLAQIHYAIWYRDAKKHQRKSYKKYLREMGNLHEFFEDEFLGAIAGTAEENKEEGKRNREEGRKPPSLEEIEAFIESGSNDWKAWNVNMDDLWRYKEYKERRDKTVATATRHLERREGS